MAEPTAHTELLRARAALDDALVTLCAIEDGSLPVRAADEQLASALEHVYRALGASGDADAFGQNVQAAAERTTAALTVLQDASEGDDAWHQCTRASAQALFELHSTRFRAGTEPFVLPRADAARPSASVGLPRTLDPPRPVLRPTVPLPPLDEPEDAAPEMPKELPPAGPFDAAALDALMAQTAASAAEADAVEARDEAASAAGGTEPVAAAKPEPVTAPPAERVDAWRFGERAPEAATLFDRARIALDEMGMLAAMRRPGDDDAWTSNRECERRVLSRVDAIVAADLSRLPRLIRLLEDRPLPDPELTLAILFVLGSLRGDDTRDEIARLLRVIALPDASMFVAVSDALALAPHPGLPGLLTRWLSDALPERRALATEVLGRKRALGSEALAAASEDQALSVQRAAARALTKYEGNLAPAASHRLLHHDDHEVARHALHGAALRGDPRALERARELVVNGKAAHGDAAYVCALCGGPNELPALAKQATPATLAAIGWYGDMDALPLLLRALEQGDDEAKASAAEALHRITGAGLTDAEPLPDYVHDPEARPFLDVYREPTAQPVDLSIKPKVWRDYWDRYGRGIKPERRYRYGRPFVAAHDLWELTQPQGVRCDRERAYLELRVRFGVQAPLDTQAFVLAQRPQLEAIATEVARAPALRSPWQSRLAR